MLKRINLYLLLALCIVTIPHCKKTDCLIVCRELTENERSLTPYNLNDTILFSAVNDTFRIICINKEYSQRSESYYSHYYYAHCGSKGLETLYWEQSSEYSTDIPYTDSSFLRIEINTRTEDYGNVEAHFTFKLYDGDWCMYNEEYTFFTRPEDPVRFYKRWQHSEGFPAKYFQCGMSYYDQLSIMGKVHDHVHILHGDIQNFDSVYYSSETGIIRMVRDSLIYNVLKHPDK